MALQDNTKPGHCCLCGVYNFGCLCLRCLTKWKNADGTLPTWLYELRTTARRETRAFRRNAERMGQNAAAKRGRGQPRKYGVTLVSLDQMKAQQFASDE